MPSTAEERKAAWDTLVGKLGEIESELKMLGTSFFGGESPNMTDYMIWPWIERLPMLNLVYEDENYEVSRTSLEKFHGWV